MSSPRLLVTLGENASCQVVEEFAAAGDSRNYFCNAVAEISLEEGACLKHGCASSHTAEKYPEARSPVSIKLQCWLPCAGTWSWKGRAPGT